MNSLNWDPILPLTILAFLAVLCIGFAVWSYFHPVRGRWMRLCSALILVAALLNPTITTKDTKSLKDIAVVLIDQSSSQSMTDRQTQTLQARQHLEEQLSHIHDLEVRFVEMSPDGREDKLGTRAMSALKQTLAGIDPARYAGAILISDGQVHDIEDHNLDTIKGPFHLFISGHKDDLDRRLTILEAPRFGLVDKPIEIKAQVLDNAIINPNAPLRVELPNGETQTVKADKRGIFRINFTPEHAGSSVLVLETDILPGEISAANNKVALTINGVHDRLRVLLVSGLPHQGQRTWRNILRSDPAVDLVHFTILRPSEKEDFTPLNELSLIAFPVRELFEEKLSDFDLIIFDRYYKHNVLSEGYFDNIRDYVENGGALLISAGPDFAGPRSLAQTRLKPVLPATPTGEIRDDKAFALKRTPVGKRHPISATLTGKEKDWGRWLRLVEVNSLHGETLLESEDQKPILMVERVNKGRLALLLSDHTWLWARGFDGGGPHLDLVRHLVHWLMKEPDLEEERLSLSVSEDNILTIKRQSLKTSLPPLTLTYPDGKTETIALKAQGKGLHTARLKAPTPGVYKVQSDGVVSVTTVGALNPKEFEDPRASEAVLAPVIGKIGGTTHWIEDSLPFIKRISPDETPGGVGWVGLVANKAEAVTGLKTTALLSPWIVFLLSGGLWVWGWWRESR